MTPAQLYAALADILGIDTTNAESLANHLMALVLGRNTTDSTSWRTVPPAQRNDLQTTEKMPTKLLNSLSSKSTSIESSVNGFSDRMTEVVGNQYAEDQEAFSLLGGNLIQIVSDIKGKIDRGEVGGTWTPTSEQEAVLSSGITAEILEEIQTFIMSIRSITDTDIDEIFDEVFN